MLFSAVIWVCRHGWLLLIIPNLLAWLVRYRERDGAKLRS